MSKDIVFKEHVFPFSNSATEYVPMFVAPLLPDYDDVPVHNIPSTDDAQEMIHNFSIPDVPVAEVTAEIHNSENDDIDQFTRVTNQQNYTGIRTSTRRSHPLSG